MTFKKASLPERGRETRGVAAPGEGFQVGRYGATKKMIFSAAMVVGGIVLAVVLVYCTVLWR